MLSRILNPVQYRILILRHSVHLDSVNEKTIVSSNSPYRKISTQNIENFIGNWTSIEVNLENNHPNAALVLVKENGSITLLSLVIRIHQSCLKNL